MASLVKVPENKEAELLQEFCNKSMFTFEGIDISDKKGLKEFEKLIETQGYNVDKNKRGWFWFNGVVMNRCYGLTESNAYPDDLVFLVIPDYYNPMVKIATGARWFDDIVANNTIKQNSIDSGTDPDFDYIVKENADE